MVAQTTSFIAVYAGWWTFLWSWAAPFHKYWLPPATCARLARSSTRVPWEEVLLQRRGDTLRLWLFRLQTVLKSWGQPKGTLRCGGPWASRWRRRSQVALQVLLKLSDQGGVRRKTAFSISALVSVYLCVFACVWMRVGKLLMFVSQTSDTDL